MNGIIKRSIARIVLASFLLECTLPPVASALTSGPVQPEFSSFEPVNTTGMVDELTGSFTYNLPVLNIPGPSGGGYALSLSYHSGASIEEEASWVGYGWTLNPGAIIRNKRGFPDDYNGKPVTYWNKVPTNWTVSVGGSTKFEAFSVDALSLGADASIRYNNYRGFSTTIGLDYGYKGIASLGYSLTDGEGGFSFALNPVKALNALSQAGKHDGFVGPKPPVTEQLNTPFFQRFNGVYTFEESRRATNITEYEGLSVNFKVDLQTTPAPPPAGGEGGISGNYSQQQNKYSSENINSFGYMYSGLAGDDDMMDYYSEKESMYSKRDYFLSIPFSNADNFAVTGEGIGGAFRLFSRTAGHFKPNTKSSRTIITQAGLAVHTGPLNVGSGFNAGIGGHSLDVKGWADPKEHSFPDPGDGDEPYFFRFNNDLGGKVEYSSDLSPYRAPVDLGGSMGWSPAISTSAIYSSVNNGSRSGRSSYIGYHTNKEMLELADPGCDAGIRGGQYYNAYSKYSAASSHVDRSKPSLHDGVGEFEIVNEAGMRYAYGLPVYSRNERNLNYGLDGIAGNKVKQNYIAEKNVEPSNAEVVVGEERPAPYASMYLLTEITTPDYVDRTNDGPTSDDFGGYTKFTYSRAAGTNDKSGDESEWYKWRIPYTGLMYDRRSLSDPADDVGGVMSGEKEMYYLDRIETKTHYAVFVTSPREDAFQANHSEGDAADGVLQTLNSEANRSRKLDRIELYAKNLDEGPDRILQTVHFRYDYSLCQGLPNASKIGTGLDRNGKLTLRKMWFEYNGVTSAKIAPYIFGYDYRRYSDYADLPADVQKMYDPVIRYGDSVTSAAENPDYIPFDLDRWGNYQYNGAARHQRFQTWVNQNPDRDDFDPAAWQLKTIRLPSGGEVQIQYEQNNYRFVQDRPAMGMVSIKGAEYKSITEVDHNAGESAGWTYFLNVSELGIDDNPSNPELQQLMKLIKKELIDNVDGAKEKIYFKFLFPLHGETANFTNCLSEYITGYLSVAEVGVLTNGSDADHQGLYIKIAADDDTPEMYDSPRDACQDFFNAMRSGNLRFGSNCDASIAGISNDMDAGELVLALLSKIGSTVLFNELNCQTDGINYDESYFRIPLTRAKLGGGLRVKRLLMYDHGGEDGPGYANLYGSEYLYQDESGLSSGVATNEPAAGREENALVTYLRKRQSQGAVEQIITGDDQEQFEGPIGESLLPGASIGYSRVVSKDIFNGATNPGFKVSEFYTVRDFPFNQKSVNEHIDGRTVDFTTMEGEDAWFPKVPLGLITYHKSNYWLSQGYRFIINSMHGRAKSIRSYTGNYNDLLNAVCVAGEEYEYFAPGEPVPMMYGIGDIRFEHPGKEEEVVFESRSIEDVLNDGSVELDASLGITGLIPIPFFTGFPNITHVENKLRTHVTSKVVRFPAILKGARVYRDGAWNTTSYLGFDPATGQPILSSTTDGHHGLALQNSSPAHDGTYYRYTMPAYQQYSDMGQRATAERLAIQSNGVTLIIEKWYDSTHYLNFRFKSPGMAASTIAKLSSGDLIRLKNSSGVYRGLYQVGKIAGNKVQLHPTSFDVGGTLKPETVNIEIMRSGRTNQLAVSRGSITTYGVPPATTDHPVQ